MCPIPQARSFTPTPRISLSIFNPVMRSTFRIMPFSPRPRSYSSVFPSDFDLRLFKGSVKSGTFSSHIDTTRNHEKLKNSIFCLLRPWEQSRRSSSAGTARSVWTCFLFSDTAKSISPVVSKYNEEEWISDSRTPASQSTI
jgi:hypothetical protein